MRLSVRWLKKFLQTDLPIDELIETITMAGHEVEEQLDLGMRSGLIVVAEVLEAEPLPNSDHLRLCKVNVGETEPLTIVCGAPNARAGIRVPCAMIGAELPGNLIIRKTEIRGQISHGMLCSGAELEYGADHAGILELPDTSQVGEPFDFLIEIKVTPNRPDCLSVLGLARDVGAMIGKPVYPPKSRFKERLDLIESMVKIEIKDRERCPRYTARLIRGIEIKPSPLWMQRALEGCGLRSINNVVDVTNYVLMELGHPLHAFDFDMLAEGTIVVRTAAEGEKLNLLDGSSLTLTAEDLLIADARRGVALAGVMGGQESEVTGKTVNVLLEAAYFDPGTIRKTARRYGLQTDASYRFERGTDREKLILALERATQLIQEVAGGEVVKGIIDVHASMAETQPILLNVDRVNALLGLDLSMTQVADYLVNLGFEIRPTDPRTIAVVPPTHRVDITRYVDLVEDVARLHNYNNIPCTMPSTNLTPSEPSPLESMRHEILGAMVSLGFSEAKNFSFIGEDAARRMGFDPADLPHVTNPLTVDQAIMRPTVLCGLLGSVASNQRQDEPDILLFELGKAWNPGAQAGDPEGEHFELGLVMAGSTPLTWTEPQRPYDYYDLKGAVEMLLARLSASPVRFTPLHDSPVYHPGRAAMIEWLGMKAGEIGELHPDLAKFFDLKGRIYSARLAVSATAEAAVSLKPAFRPIPRFPGSWRDLALIVEKTVAAVTLLDIVGEAGGELLEEVRIFDLYEGSHVPEGSKSVALRMRLRSPESTLTEDDINKTVEKIVKQLGEKAGASLRA